MPVPIHFPPPGFDDLSIDEKIDYLELLWERIATSPECDRAFRSVIRLNPENHRLPSSLL